MPSDNLSCKRSVWLFLHQKSAIALAILAVGIFSAVYCHDKWPDDLFFCVGFAIPPLVILIPLMLVIGIIALLNKFLCKPPLRQRIGKLIGWLFVMVGSMGIAAVLFVALSIGLVYWPYWVAQRYVAHAVPILETIKAQTGSYPSTLPEAKFGKPPYILRYTGGGDQFDFLYMDEDGVGIYEFYSSDKIWHGTG